MDVLCKNFSLILEIDYEINSKIKLEKEELFFKVWRNVFIRNKCIFYHLRNFKIANFNIKHNFESLREYPLRNYLTGLKITNDETLQNDIDFGSTIPNKIIPNSVGLLIINQNILISKGDLPDSIHTLAFGKRFRELISNDMIPKNVIKLKLGYHTKIDEDFILPKCIKSLSIERKSQLSLLDQVTSSIEYLGINECDADTKIPTTIKSLGLTSKFHNKLPIIPPNIEYLHIGNKFSKEIDFLDLKHLKILKIGRSKKFKSLSDIALSLKQLIYLKVYSEFYLLEYHYNFTSLQILCFNDQLIEIFEGFVDLKNYI
ncbi:hypothetical protein DDB_G0275997 [Dictyostelium discoideum AX4]|uniref:FNIP repeat-containing protein n=1 Tax=Dictyostelium discoideum TaxID=44689 RepID=Q552L2_DICDI|nr:hypothetical protein DDB_G0275997 [Dictyostelium discoideum AX4]EAL69455.1 hypothetical protein DDB_G0275997 [Dictyostelium discoideum AX4]|eukprot:XP_643370.1 hypothetical protein DDB_G0275997 [Dictyostelium discoideum AX4]